MQNRHTGYWYISEGTERIWFEGFACTLTFVQLRATSVRHLCSYFSEATGTPVCARFSLFLQSNIFDSTTIKLKWRTIKHLFKFYMELDGISSTSFQVFDYANIKGKRQRNLEPFYFAWLNLRLPPRLHVTRARPYQGGSWECWGPPWISIFETWNISWEYICLYSYRHAYIQIHLC